MDFTHGSFFPDRCSANQNLFAENANHHRKPLLVIIQRLPETSPNKYIYNTIPEYKVHEHCKSMGAGKDCFDVLSYFLYFIYSSFHGLY